MGVIKMKEEIRAKMILHGHTQEVLAKLLEISYTSLSYKLNEKKEFRPSEIRRLRELYKLSDSEIVNMFIK